MKQTEILPLVSILPNNSMFKFWQKKGVLFKPAGHYSATHSGHGVVLCNGHSATLDFYFRSRQNQFSHYREIDTRQVYSPETQKLPEGSLIILVRDIPVNWLKWLLLENNQYAGVVWFMDDDFPGAHSDRSLPKAYRKRLTSWYQKAFPLLARLCNQLWVSTPYLAQKYHLPESAVLPPVEPGCSVPQPLVRCFYHGSSSHTQEWAFVREVVGLVQEYNPDTWFELMGDHALYRQFRGIPRISILHPMQWPDYLAMTSSRNMDIGLAPLMDSPFNLSRSHTKFLDITRQSAVGIYSERFCHAQEIMNSGAGLVLPDDPQVWSEEIGSLIKQDRSTMLDKAYQLRTLLSQ